VYTRIVVGTDGSDRSLTAQPVGEAASVAFDCPLELLHVPASEDPPGLDTTGMTVRPAPDPAAGLVEHAAETDPPGLLCLSARGRGSVGELVFGSVTAQVIRSLHTPLVIVGPSVADASASAGHRQGAVCSRSSRNSRATSIRWTSSGPS
jgi:nucleotide-binding universal stress UspA family protein